MDRLFSTSGGEATAFEYTHNGALLLERHTLTNSVRRQLSWNAEGRLVAVSGTGGAGSYAYDPQGRRISQQEGGHLTRMQSDGSGILYEFDASPSATKYFVHGTGVDDVLSVHSSSAVQYYQKDGLGSVVGLSNSTGSLVAQYVYKVFGVRQDALSLGLSAAISNRFGFTRREHDNTGMTFYRARYMLPEQGRFGSRDTYACSDSVVASLNRYGYVLSNPANLADPSGNYPCPGGRWTGEQYGFSLTFGFAHFEVGFWLLKCDTNSVEAVGTYICGGACLPFGLSVVLYSETLWAREVFNDHELPGQTYGFNVEIVPFLLGIGGSVLTSSSQTYLSVGPHLAFPVTSVSFCAVTCFSYM